MRQYKKILWPVLALTALVLACTNDDSVAIDAPAPSQGYTYKLRLNMSRPGSATRADYAWPNGSKVEICFTTADGTIDGTATYSTAEEEWTTITSDTPLPAAKDQSCKVRYLRPNADGLTPSFLTPTYAGNSKYSCDAWKGDGTDAITIDTLTLKPATWRLRFQGTKDTVLTLSSDDIVDDQSNNLTSLTLTVADDGYTPFVYALFANTDGDNTIIVETGGNTYTRTIIGNSFVVGKSIVLAVPTDANYEVEGWSLIEEPHTAADVTPLTFAATPASPQTIAVTSNEEWIATSSASEWCSVSPSTGTNSGTVTVTATENTSPASRTATITIKGQTSSEETLISVTQSAAEITDSAPAGAEAVDLGLSVKWANMNVGAEKPEDYGHYFAWGETVGYSSDINDGRSFNWAQYKWMTEGQSSWHWVNKYQVADGQTDGCWYSSGQFVGDGLSTLLPEDDAATQNWGANWRMPTFSEIQELLDNTTYTWTTCNGVNGGLFTSNKNGNSIFIPAAGYRSNMSLDPQGAGGYVWSSSIIPSNSDGARRIVFNSGNHYWSNDFYRYHGQSVRPVQESESSPIILTLSPESLSFEALDGSQDVTITCNTAWTASSDKPWCTISKDSGTGNGTITITVTENTSKDPRTATVTVTAGTVTKEVTVTQKGKTIIDVTPFDDDENWD